MKTIVGVDYRHALPTAYLQVFGRTPQSAEYNAKRVCTALKHRLPDTAIIESLKDRGNAEQGFIVEIPVIIAECEAAAKLVINQMVLKGAA